MPGLRGEAGRAGVAVGSTAAHLAVGSAGPVVLVPRTWPVQGPQRSTAGVTVGVDAHAPSAAALAFAFEAARLCGARLHAVYAWKLPPYVDVLADVVLFTPPQAPTHASNSAERVVVGRRNDTAPALRHLLEHSRFPVAVVPSWAGTAGRCPGRVGPAVGPFGPCERECPRRTVKGMGSRQRIAVIGVGNEFRRDDGAGWAVLAGLRKRASERPLPSDTVLATCDGDPGRLIGLWQDAELAVVVDAAHAHPGVPGRVHRLELDAGHPAQPPTTSSHGLGLGEAVELARALGQLPDHLVVYAVEGADSTLGTGLSPAVAAAVEPLVRAVESEIARHRRTAGRGPV